MGMTAFVLTAVIPLYCLLVTPGDAVATYSEVFRESGSELSQVTRALGGIPKVLLILGWLVLMLAQMAACFLIRPRWWASLLQIVIVLPVVLIYGLWHIATVHLPMLHLFNDLS